MTCLILIFILKLYAFFPVALLFTALLIKTNDLKQTMLIVNKAFDRAICCFFTKKNLEGLLLSLFLVFIFSLVFNMELLTIYYYYFFILSVFNILEGLYLICTKENFELESSTIQIFEKQILILLNASFSIIIIKGIFNIIELLLMNKGEGTIGSEAPASSSSQNNPQEASDPGGPSEPNPRTSHSNINPQAIKDEILLNKIKGQASLTKPLRIHHVYTKSNTPGIKDFTLTAEERNRLGEIYLESGEEAYVCTRVDYGRVYVGEYRIHSTQNRKIFIRAGKYLIDVLEKNIQRKNK